MPSLESVLAQIPGYAGYRAARQANDEETLNGVKAAHGVTTLQGILQAQQDAARAREALAGSGGNLESAIPALMKAGPGGVEMAGKLAAIAEHQANSKTREVAAAEAARKAAFFSPDNQAKFVEGAKPAVPASSDGIGVIPEQPAVPGEVNFDKFLQAAATQGVVNPETYANHIAQQRQRIADNEQKVTLAREKLAQDLQLARERGENAQVLRQMMIDGQRSIHEMIAANRPEPLVPVKGTDGRVIYMPRSQAAGQEVGSRVTDTNVSKQVQQLGKDFERAGLPTMINVVGEAMKLTPGLEKWVSGPKSALPDILVRDADGLKAADILRARQDVAKLFNITLKDRSGAAVTNQELERLKKEFGSGVFKQPGQLLAAIKRASQIVDDHYKGIAASYGKDVLDGYNGNLEAVGGRPFKPGAPSAPNSVIDAADAILKGG